MEHALSVVYERLMSLTPVPSSYQLPALWVNPVEPGDSPVRTVEPVGFFRDRIGGLLLAPDQTPVRGSTHGEWTRDAVVYNMFVRQTTAWDHDGDGRIGLEDLPGGFRETGTFLKSIMLLPYLTRLGINTIHLLPVTLIGSDGNKGTLGSPYAIRNPFKLDERQSEPFLELGADVEFAAFVEAAHRFGMRVVVEFVFRTASKDSEWITEHPNWFYWIDADVPDRAPGDTSEHGYGSPRFSTDELAVIATRVRRNDTASLPPPSRIYRQMFADPPDEVAFEDGRAIGLSGERRVRIPGAFADWPPDDVQPPWNDVTYLKLYDHGAFNYIAYNTIRVYDARLAQIDNENRGLWNTIINIIPHYQRSFGIDGVMIDMGHALPRRLKQSIVERARKLDPDFAFWEENFAISARSRQEGYNAAVGYLWSDEHLPHKLREFLTMLASVDTPVPFFATPESHNTPRAAARPGGIAFSRLALFVNAFLPAVFFVHQGYELGETFPVNTGLGFTPEEIAARPSHTLPLFSESALCWTRPEQITALIARVLEIRRQWNPLVTNPSKLTFRLAATSHPDALAFRRCDETHGDILVVVNLNVHETVEVVVDAGWGKSGAAQAVDEVSGYAAQVDADGRLTLPLPPGGGMIFTRAAVAAA